MFKNTFQSGFLSILYSIGSKPLQIWDKKVRNGHIKRITDNDIQSLVLELVGTNCCTTYITCPADPKKTLGIKLPFLVMIVKNMKKYFSFLKFRFWTTKMWEDVSVPQIISQRQEWNLSFAQCQWGWTTGGIRFNSTWAILQEERTGPITWKLFVCNSTLIVESVEYIFQIVFTRKMNCLQSLSSICRFKRNQEGLRLN